MLPLTTASSTNYSSSSSTQYSRSTTYSLSGATYSLSSNTYSVSSSATYSNSSTNHATSEDLDLSNSSTAQGGSDFFLPLPSCSSFLSRQQQQSEGQQPEQPDLQPEEQLLQPGQRSSEGSTLSDDSVLRSSECDICGKDITHLVQQVHYGARACFSCRAFFRRAQKAKRRPKWRCKKEGACLINEKTRRFCAKCRYLRCLDVGMKESLVLTEEEKTHRFRKVLKKKRRLAKQAKLLQDPEDLEDLEDPEDLEDLEDPEDLDASFSLASLMPKEDGPDNGRGGGQGDGEGVGGLPILKLLREVHAGLLSPYLDQSHIAELAQLLERRFRSMAFAQDAFLALASAERHTLLAQNTPLYLQAILCQYFMSTSGPEQATVLLLQQQKQQHPEGECAQAPAQQQQQRFRVSIGDIDRYTLSIMFGEDSLLKNTLVKLLRSVCEGLRDMRDYFDFDDVHKMILFEGLEVATMSDMGKCGVGVGAALVRDLLSRVKHLQLIKQFQNDLELLAYMSMALCCFQQLRHSGLEVRASFAVSADNFCALVQERARAEVRRIVVLHERHIDAGLDALVREKAPKVAALLLARLDLAQTLEEQLAILNLARFPASLAGRRGGGGGERIKIFHCNPAIKAVLQPRQDRFQRLLNKYRLYLGNGDLFLLLVLLAIFGRVSKLQTAYLSVLSAVMANLPPGMEEEGGPACPPCPSVNNCLENLDELSNLCACFTYQQVA